MDDIFQARFLEKFVFKGIRKKIEEYQKYLVQREGYRMGGGGFGIMNGADADPDPDLYEGGKNFIFYRIELGALFSRPEYLSLISYEGLKVDTRYFL